SMASFWNVGPRWSMVGRSMARRTRSGTLVGPGIWRKWRPLLGGIEPLFQVTDTAFILVTIRYAYDFRIMNSLLNKVNGQRDRQNSSLRSRSAPCHREPGFIILLRHGGGLRL